MIPTQLIQYLGFLVDQSDRRKGGTDDDYMCESTTETLSSCVGIGQADREDDSHLTSHLPGSTLVLRAATPQSFNTFNSLVVLNEEAMLELEWSNKMNLVNRNVSAKDPDQIIETDVSIQGKDVRTGVCGYRKSGRTTSITYRSRVTIYNSVFLIAMLVDFKVLMSSRIIKN